MFRCKHELVKDEPLVVSGRGYTEYKITFCKKCGKLIWRMTKDYDSLYPKYNNGKWSK